MKSLYLRLGGSWKSLPHSPVSSLLSFPFHPYSTNPSAELGLLLADVKHIYFAGFRSYISNSYNILNFCILSMYIGSYTLRIIVDQWVRESDVFFNATVKINHLLDNNNSVLVHQMVQNWTQSDHFDKSYFITACEFAFFPPSFCHFLNSVKQMLYCEKSGRMGSSCVPFH